MVTVSLLAMARADDWPMWRHDAARSAISTETLASNLHLQWARQLETPRQAWRDKSNANINFDQSYEPVVAGKVMYIGSMNDDTITAYSTTTGKQLWRYVTDGPVRFAPVVYKSKVYAGSDDGYLYCLDAKAGTLVWRFQAVPRSDKILGNERLISRWPVRGAPVIYDDVLYFAASIWAFEGTFIYAMDPETSKVLWCNSGSGTDWRYQPHGTPAYAGVCPQGYLAASKNRLLIPSGRGLPGGYDRATGKFVYWDSAGSRFGKGSGGYDVSIDGDTFFNRIGRSELGSGKRVGKTTPAGLLASGEVHHAKGKAYLIYSCDKKKDIVTADLGVAIDKVHALVGKTALCSSASGDIVLVDLSNRDQPKVAFQAKVSGSVWTMIAADKKLFVVQNDGTISCFGPKKVTPKTYITTEVTLPATKSTLDSEIASILAAKATPGGHALIFDAGDSALIDTLLAQSKMHLIVLDADPDKIAALRKRLFAQGVYGRRVSAAVADPATTGLPAYLAELIFLDGKSLTAEKLATVYKNLRPYGGTMCISGTSKARIESLLKSAPLAGAVVGSEGQFVSVCRKGALPGSSDWTHQYADAGNTVMSPDQLVKPPFGLLWFGGPSNDAILPRHGHGPAPQVAGGRILIEGENMFRALDVYTGRLLWQLDIQKLGYYYRHTGHHPGAGEIGSNYVSFPEAIYLNTVKQCMELNPATGETRRAFELPATAGKTPSNIGFMTADKSALVLAGSPVTVTISHLEIPPEAEATYVSPELSFDTDGKATIDIDVNVKGAKQLMLVMQPIKKHHSGPTAWLAPRLTVGKTKTQSLMELPWLETYTRGRINKGINAYNGPIMINKKARKDGIGVHNTSAILYKLPAGYDRFQCTAALDDIDRKRMPRAKAVIYVIKNPELITPKTKLTEVKGVKTNDEYSASSKHLYVYDRKSGKLLWKRPAAYNFRHNAIAIGGDTLFCIDSITSKKMAYLKRRGLAVSKKPTLYALDLTTGEVRWKTDKDVFGTWLGYSAEEGVLIQAGSRFRDRASDEIGRGISVFDAKTGDRLWQDLNREYGGPLILYHDQFITNGNKGEGFSLRTGEPMGWAWTRHYGCNTATGGEHLLLFRSSSASYFDLTNKGGTVNFGGFKSGCTSNMIPADGVLNIPDYTRTCTCSYQNQTSVGLIHRPDTEFWSAQGNPEPGKLGVNLGAEGDRLSGDGVYWVEYPLSGSKESVKNTIAHTDGKFYQHHSLLYPKGKTTWIGASGVQGASKVSVANDEDIYTVRLYFAEPDRTAKPGQRVFSVSLNGKRVCKNLDVTAETKQPRKVLVKEFTGVAIDKELLVEMTASKGKTLLCGIEMIKE